MAEAIPVKTILSLDIDGVLNGHERLPNGYCGIKKECVAVLNRIIDETDCDIVIHSAWRYMVHSGSMTVEGLGNLLASHGVKVFRGISDRRIVGITRPDNGESLTDRRAQILEYPKDGPWFAIDDLDLALPPEHFYQTCGATGLRERDGDCILERMKKLEADRG